MFLGIRAAGDAVAAGVEPPAAHGGAAHGDALTLAVAQGTAALGPPPRLARVGEHHAHVILFLLLLLLQRLDDRDHAALVDAARAANHAVREDAQLLLGLADDDHDAACGAEVARDEDGGLLGDLVLGSGGGRECGDGRKGDLDELVARGEAGMDDVLDGEVEGKALALVVAGVLGEKEVEVELGIGIGADLVGLVDVVAGARGSAIIHIHTKKRQIDGGVDNEKSSCDGSLTQASLSRLEIQGHRVDQTSVVGTS